MSVLSVQSPYPIFTDTDGDPLESGYIWIGVANLDPQVNPLAVYWDAALTMPAVQPIRTLAGYPSQAGSPGRIYTNADHSIRVQNKRGTIVFTAGNVRDRFSSDLIGYVGPDGLQYTVQDLADSSNVLKGDALIAVKNTAPGGIARTQHDKNQETCTVEDFGAVGDGIADDTAAIQAAIDSLIAGGIVNFTSVSYKLTTNLNVTNEGITLYFPKNSTLTWTALGVGKTSSYGAMTTGIKVDANYFQIIGANLVGPHTASYVANACLIQMVGTDKNTRLIGFRMMDCQLSNVGSYGLFLQYVNWIFIDRSYIHDLGYCGMLFLSCEHGDVRRNRIETISPGTVGNMYGIAISMYAPTGWEDLTGTYDPMCRYFNVVHNFIEDIAWEGIDAHGSKDLFIQNNHIYNTRQGIGVSTNSNIGARYGGFNVYVLHNVIDGRNSDGTTSGRENLQYGINVEGGNLRKGSNVKVIGNKVLYKGIVSNGNPAAGAIQCGYNDGLEVASNEIDYWGGNAIAYDLSENAIFKSNIICRLANVGDTAGYGFIATTAIDTSIIATDNQFLKKDRVTAKTAWRQQNNVRRALLANNYMSECATQFSLDAVGFLRGSQVTPVLSVTSDTTPSVLEFTSGTPILMEVSNGAGLTITDIDDGIRGQIVIIKNIGAGNVTFTRANARLSGGASWVGTTYQSLTLIKANTGEWHEIFRSGAIS